MGQVAVRFPAHRSLAGRPDRARPAVPAAAALDHHARSGFGKGCRRAYSMRPPAAAPIRGDLWRYTSPYRGLAAMEEKDSDYFFGRERETVDVLAALAGATDRLAGAHRQFRRGQILAGAGRRARGAQTPGLA